jgi:hypothetical protein
MDIELDSVAFDNSVDREGPGANICVIGAREGMIRVSR